MRERLAQIIGCPKGNVQLHAAEKAVVLVRAIHGSGDVSLQRPEHALVSIAREYIRERRAPCTRTQHRRARHELVLRTRSALEPLAERDLSRSESTWTAPGALFGF